MESLTIKYQNALQAVKTLTAALEIYRQRSSLVDAPLLSKEDQQIVLRDAVIKRFEYSIDTTWKYLKEYLRVQYGIEQNSPKPIFRECKKNLLLSEHEAEMALEMVDDRNLTSHTYKEEVAELVISAAPKYCSLLSELLKKTNPILLD